VHAAIDCGSMATLNCREEVDLAELLCDLHPWAEMVRYARCGGEAMAIAVRIARARNGREKVAFCGYHGWHDWYLAANLGSESALDGHLLPGLEPAGVPRSLAGTALAFHYNCASELEDIVRAHGPDLAAIVMEPIRSHEPVPGFLERDRELADRAGAVLVFDEVTAAWRMNTGGAHLRYSVTPDVAVFAKAISNGYPMAAIIGRSEVMQAAQDSFISSTYWTERIGPTAALATIRKYQRCSVWQHLIQAGNRIQTGWREAAERAGLPISISGIPPLAHFVFETPGAQALKTLFTQRMLERGFLATNAYYATVAHSVENIIEYLSATGDVFHELADAVHRGTVEKLLKGPVAHAGFYRLS
jgi:glutamate-1-semialdehyde 2,1-aminomutase